MRPRTGRFGDERARRGRDLRGGAEEPIVL